MEGQRVGAWVVWVDMIGVPEPKRPGPTGPCKQRPSQAVAAHEGGGLALDPFPPSSFWHYCIGFGLVWAGLYNPLPFANDVVCSLQCILYRLSKHSRNTPPHFPPPGACGLALRNHPNVAWARLPAANTHTHTHTHTHTRHPDTHLVRHARRLRRPSTPGPAHQGGVRLVQREQEAVAALESHQALKGEVGKVVECVGGVW